MSADEKRPLSTFITVLDSFTLAQVRDALLDLRTLSPQQRVIAIGGYLVFLAMIICTFALELIDGRFDELTYVAENITRQISWPAVAVCSLGFTMGWAYLLAGAAQARWFVTVLCFGLFALLCLLAPDIQASFWEYSAVGWVVVMVIGMLVIARRLAWLEEWPYLVLLVVASVIGLGTAVYWLSGTEAERGLGAYAVFGAIFWLTEPVWLMAGLSVVSFGILVTGGIVSRIRRSASERTIRWITVLALLLQPPIAFVMAIPFLFFGGESTLFQYAGLFGNVLWFDAISTLLLWLPAGILLALRRWTARNAALLLAVRLSIFMYILAFGAIQVSGFDVSNPVFGAVERLQMIPPAVLTTTMIFFYLQSRDVVTGEEISSGLIIPATFFMGSVLLGLPYLLFVALRRPETLIGEDPAAQPESTQLPPSVSSTAGRSWAIFVLVLPLLLFGCGCCALTFIGMLGAQ